MRNGKGVFFFILCFLSLGVCGCAYNSLPESEELKDYTEEESHLSVDDGDNNSFEIEIKFLTNNYFSFNNNLILFLVENDDNSFKIDYNQIEGKVIATIPKIGAILTILKNKIVFAIILILLIISYYWQKRTITKKIQNLLVP